MRLLVDKAYELMKKDLDFHTICEELEHYRGKRGDIFKQRLEAGKDTVFQYIQNFQHYCGKYPRQYR